MVAADRHPVHVLWLTSGLGCDGDSVAMTAARNPSFEDLIRGCFPGAPPVVIYNPLLAYETGDEFMRAWFEAAAGKLEPFIFVLEGSVPNEEISGDGYWATMGVDPATGDPISTCTWIDRLAPRAAVGAGARHVRDVRRDPGDAKQPDRRDGAARLPRVELDAPASTSRSSTCPAARRSPTTSPRRCCTSRCTSVGAGADDRRRRAWPPALAVRRTVQQGCGRAGFAEQGEFAQTPADHRGCLVKLGCKGPVGEVQRSAARLGWRRRRVPERRRHLQRMHDAGISRQVHAVHGRRIGSGCCTRKGRG